MGLPYVSRIPLAPDWDPRETATAIHDEVERKWNEGWVFRRAEADALLESVCLYFERPQEAAAEIP
jgi:hypothetical protein